MPDKFRTRERYGEAFWIGDLTTDDGKNAAAWAGR
jgi:hypothetical protein